MALAAPTSRPAPAALPRRLVREGLPAAWFRRLALVAVVALALIIVSGAAVRLTGSGLGCPDWPNCTATRVVAPWQFHAWVEFGNRLITALLSVAVVATVAGALLRERRRRDLTLLSFGLVAGIAAEIVLGGLTVENHLKPQYVTAHFLLAVVFLADAVWLHHRAGLADQPVPGHPRRAVVAGRPVLLVRPEQRILARITLCTTAVVLVLGTVVTSSGPHAGAPDVPRYHFSLHSVAQLHGSSVEITVALVALTLVLMVRSRAPRQVLVAGEILLVVLIAQGAVGYTQYFLGVPAALVEVHEFGAVAVVVAMLRFNLALTARSAEVALPPAPARVGVAAG